MTNRSVISYPDPSFSLDQQAQAVLDASRQRRVHATKWCVVIAAIGLIPTIVSGLWKASWVGSAGFFLFMLSMAAAGLFLGAHRRKVRCANCGVHMEKEESRIEGDCHHFIVCRQCRRYACTHAVTD
ncbi:MAG: hypothetical protein HS117_08970 [Verrucomicrobiaceae bacterium]|nr:hypothetical protein [Verrucomicrobiaceae bacterium]